MVAKINKEVNIASLVKATDIDLQKNNFIGVFGLKLRN